jgi:hypothetical protein
MEAPDQYHHSAKHRLECGPPAFEPTREEETETQGLP